MFKENIMFGIYASFRGCMGNDFHDYMGFTSYIYKLLRFCNPIFGCASTSCSAETAAKRATMRPCNKIHGRTWCLVTIWGGKDPSLLHLIRGTRWAPYR